MNGDHKPDAVISSSGKISAFLGNGDGTFQPERTLFPSSTNSPLAIADLNGDGKPDLVFTRAEPVAEVALGAGDGTFGTPTKYLIGWGDSLAIADMNGDGFPDIVTSGFTILFGDGHGGFPKRADYWQEVTGNIILADFDGDGKPEIIVGTGTPARSLGLRSWSSSRAATAHSAARQSVSSADCLEQQLHYSQVADDFDGDGNLDLVVQLADRVNVLKGIGDGTFRQTFQYIPASGYPTSIAAADLNRDGKLDIVVSIANAPTARTEVLLGNGDGTFQAPLAVTSACCVTALCGGRLQRRWQARRGGALPQLQPRHGFRRVADLSRDRRRNICRPAGFRAGCIPQCAGGRRLQPRWKTGRGSRLSGRHRHGAAPRRRLEHPVWKRRRQFLSARPDFLGIGNPQPAGLVTADWNGDGQLDLAVPLNNGTLLVLLGRGNGTFQAPTTYPYSATRFDRLAVADLNGMESPTLIGTGPNWLLGNGDGTFRPEVTFAGNAYPPMIR